MNCSRRLRIMSTVVRRTARTPQYESDSDDESDAFVLKDPQERKEGGSSAVQYPSYKQVFLSSKNIPLTNGHARESIAKHICPYKNLVDFGNSVLSVDRSHE